MSELARELTFTGAAANRLAADVRGTGPPVALLMHGGGQTRHSWGGTAERMARAGMAAVTVDARGHGDSAWVASRAYSFERMSADLVRVAEQATERFGTRPVLVGASMGGLAAMHACRERPDLFAALVFVDITPRMEASGVDKVVGFMAERAADGFGSVEEAADTISAYLPERRRPRTLDGLAKNLRQRDDGRWYWHWDPAFVAGPESITSGGHTRAESVFAEGLRRASALEPAVPMLLVRGSRSELVSERSVEAFMAAAPHARFVDVSDAGHMVAGDRNDVFADAVIAFIRDVTSDHEPEKSGARRSAKAASPSA